MAVVFAVMHLYNTLIFLLFLSIPFFQILKKNQTNMVLINRRNSPRYHYVLALCVFLTGAYRRDYFFENLVFDVCLCFVLCKFVLGLILWFLENLWFDDFRRQIEVCFSRGVIRCG